MDTLIFVNYQRTIPPYLFNEILACQNIYKNIVYINPSFKNDNRNLIQNKNVSFQIGTKKDELVSFLLLPFLIFGKDSINNILQSFKLKKFGFSFLKEHICYIYETRTLMHLLKKASKTYKEGIVMAAWYNACALAVGKFCFKHHSFKAYSFAHAFEVNPAVSKNLGCTFDISKINYVNKAFFISNTIKEQYCKYMVDNNININLEKIKVRYLGVFDNGLNAQISSYHKNNPLRVLSCSYALPIKRLNLIYDALNECKKPIEWIHIGEGPSLEQIKESYLNKKNKNFVFKPLGYFENKKVIEYLKNNQIDLFINVSSSEGLPVSIMEAISFGLPVIATDVGGTHEIVDENVGFLLPKDFEINSLVNIIEDFVNLDDNQVKIYKKNARKRFEDNFNISSLAISFYQNLE